MADLSTLETIKASDKPTENDFSYIYAESANKAFIRIAKEELKKLILDGEYTNEEIDQKISTIPKFTTKVVSSLPTTDISETTVYLVSSGNDSENLYTEYININGLWEILGTQKSTFSGSAKDVTYDDTETKLGATNVQDAFGKLSATIDDMKENGTGGTGWTTAQINLLDSIGNFIPFTSAEGGMLWDNLINSLKGNSSGGEEPDNPDEPDTPVVTLTSISATYTGGEVATGTALTDLTGITVTAHYSDGTSKTVTGYTLSGEVLEGENTITVSYGGKSTSFTVTGVAESGGGDATAELPTDGLYAFADFRNVEATRGDYYTSVIPSQGSAKDSVYFNTTNNSHVINEYGINGRVSLCNASAYPSDSNRIVMGTEFTFATVSYDGTATNGIAYPDGYGFPSNVALLGITAKYNKLSGTGSVDITVSSENRYTGYRIHVVVVDGNTAKIYVNGNLQATYEGSSYEDFASWYSMYFGKQTQTSTIFTAIAVYNKALSEVELVELDEYLKTLEVA